MYISYMYYILIVISVYSDCVYDIGRFIVYLVIYYFFVGSGVGILVVYLVSVYLVLFWFGR